MQASVGLPCANPGVISIIDEATRIKRSPQVAAHGLGASEGGVLLHLKSGQYHGVDSVGWTIWSLLDGSRNIAELAEELRVRFPDAPSHLNEDVSTFVRDLLQRNLVEVIEPQGPEKFPGVESQA